jgi:hypothetical protein
LLAQHEFLIILRFPLALLNRFLLCLLALLVFQHLRQLGPIELIVNENLLRIELMPSHSRPNIFVCFALDFCIALHYFWLEGRCFAEEDGVGEGSSLEV